MTTGWENLDGPVVEDSSAASRDKSDPVSDFNFGGASATDAIFVEPTDDRETAGLDDSPSFHEGDRQAEQRPKKKRFGLFIAMAGFAAVALGGTYLAISPFLALFSDPQAATQSKRAAPATLALEAMKSTAPAAPESPVVQAPPLAPPQSAVVQAPPLAAPVSPASAPPVVSATTPPAIASAPSAPIASAAPAATPAAATAPTPAPALAAPPATKVAEGKTADAVAAVLANAQRTEPVQAGVSSSASGPKPQPPEVSRAATGTSAVSPAAAPARAEPVAKRPVQEAPAALEGAGTQARTASKKPSTRQAKALAKAGTATPAEPPSRRPVAKRAAPKASISAKAPTKSTTGSTTQRHSAEMVIGYTLLAINPRTGDFQQAWVRDGAGKLQIVGAGDRLGSLQVLRIDGLRGEVVTGAGVIR
jgi:hypothetical protein